MATLKRLEFDIHETAVGWICTQTNRTYKTVVRAQRAVDRRCKQITMDTQQNTVATINWHTTTHIGAAVVKSVTQ